MGRAFVLVGFVLVATGGCLSKDNPLYGVGEGNGSGGTTNTSMTTTTSAATTTGPDDGSTSGAPRPGVWCEGELVLEEEFNAVPVGTSQWWISDPDSVTVFATDGELHLDLQVPEGGAGFWVMGSVDPIPSSGTLGFEVLAPPDSTIPAQLLVGLNEGQWLLQYTVSMGTLALGWWDQTNGSVEELEAIPFDPVVHRWIRLRYDTTARVAQSDVSPDGAQWTHLWSADLSRLERVGPIAQFSLGAWAGPISDADAAAIDHAFMCVGI